MVSIRRSSRLARRRQARFDRDRARIARHFHQTALLPEPWGPLELPVTFSRGHYEQQGTWFSELVGGVGLVGGPVGGVGCGCPEGRGPVRCAPGLAYWQVTVAPETAVLIAEASRISLLRHTVAAGAHMTLHLDDDFLGPLNCRSSLHATITGRVGDTAEAEDRAAVAEDRRWPDITDPNERVRWLWRFGHETALALGYDLPPLPPDDLDVRTAWRARRAAVHDA